MKFFINIYQTCQNLWKLLSASLQWSPFILLLLGEHLVAPNSLGLREGSSSKFPTPVTPFTYINFTTKISIGPSLWAGRLFSKELCFKGFPRQNTHTHTQKHPKYKLFQWPYKINLSVPNCLKYSLFQESQTEVLPTKTFLNFWNLQILSEGPVLCLSNESVTKWLFGNGLWKMGNLENVPQML